MAQARNEFQVRSPQAARARSSSNTSQHDIRLAFIRPGKPVENEYIESFNGKFRDECLNEHWFFTMDHARRAIETWREEYNAERPHSPLADLTPNEYAWRHAETAEQKVSSTAESNCEPD
jgi:putative transposase